MLQVMECPCCNTERRACKGPIRSLKFGVATSVWLKKKKRFFFISGYRQSAHMVPVSNAHELAAVIFSSIF